MSAFSPLIHPAVPTLRAAQPRFGALAFTTFVSALVLIAAGSIVRVTGNGLGCPDWPLCYGQIMPPLNIAPWVEFSHRLIGAATGVQIVALALLAWGDRPRQPRRVWLATGTVALLGMQVALGGVHVIFELPPASGWTHTGVAMAITGLLAVQVAESGIAAKAAASARAIAARDRGLPVAIATTAVATYVLILTGAYVTRTGASLACPGFPDCGMYPGGPAFPRLAEIQMFHRFMAFGVALSACLTLWRLARAARGEAGFRGAVLVLIALMAAQFGLGIANVLLRLPMWSRTLHLLVAALLWAGLVMLWAVLLEHRPEASNAEESRPFPRRAGFFARSAR